MSNQSDIEAARARKARMVAIVIAVAMCGWLLLQVIGPRIGLDGSYALLGDFAALAAFVWALIVAFQIWRSRQDT